jgi:hypothetical protein
MAGLTIEVQPSAEPITLKEAKDFLRVDDSADDLLITSLIQAAREACEVFTSRSFCNKGYLMTLDSFPYFTDSIASQQAYPPAYYSAPRYSTTLWNYSQMIKLWRPPCVRVDRITYLAASDAQWHDLTPAPGLWYPKTAYVINDKVVDNKGNVHHCTTAGTSTANPPAWNYTLNGVTTEVQDAQGEGTGSVVWHNDGKLDSLLGDDQFGFFILDKTTNPARLFPGPASAMWPAVLYVPGAVQIHYTAGYSTDGSKVPEAIKTAMKMCLANWYENREAAQLGAFGELPNHVKMLLYTYKIMDFQPTRG